MSSDSSPTLSDEFATRILEAAENVPSLNSSAAQQPFDTIVQAAEQRDPEGVADGYNQLKDALEGGSEDEDVYGMSIMNGQKKAMLQDFLTECGIVYGYLNPNSDRGSRNVPRDYVFDTEE